MTATTATAPAVALADLAESWYLTLRAERKSPATVDAYRAGVGGFLTWHTREFPAAPPVLDAATVAAWLVDLQAAGQSAGTCRLRFAALRVFARWLHDEGEITGPDPLAKMRPPKADEPVVPRLTEQQLEALIRACRGNRLEDRRDEALIRLMAETGMRAGEAIALRLTDVDLKAGVVIIRRGKGGKGRPAKIGPKTAVAIDRYLRKRRTHKLARETGALWLGGMSRTFGYQGLLAALGARAKKAGIKGFHPHVLRHTFASRYLEKGGRVEGLVEAGGWTSMEMALRYAKSDRQARAMEEAERLNLGDIG